MNKIIKEEAKDIRSLIGRFRRRDFSGTEGQAIKNSSYTLATTIIAKAGSFIFTIIIARMLLPELFGLYSLALSTILLFALFSELGIGTAMLTFVSKALGKNNPGKAKTYFRGLYRYKIYLILLSTTILILSAKFISNNYYNKPIFFALLAGALYVPVTGLQSYLSMAFFAENNFKHPLFRELIFQISRIILVPLSILWVIQSNNSSQIVLTIILALFFCYLLAFIFLRFVAKKHISFLKEKGTPLTKSEKDRLKRFIIPLSLIAFSGLFFGYVDTLMLGHYVESKFIGYYGAVLGLIGAAGAIISFIPSSILPIFSRLSGKDLEKTFRKTRNITAIVAVLAAIFTFFVAKYVLLIYGVEYLPAVPILKLFSLLIILIPLTGLYDIYLTSQERTLLVAKLLVASTILNVLLNWFFITQGLNYSMMGGVIGACIATITSRSIYFIGIGILRKTTCN